MNRLAGIISSMNYKELRDIQRDLAEGNIGKLISVKMRQMERALGYDERVCPTCGGKVNEENAKYMLVFGAKDFRKKAMFDEVDCLSFFIEKLREQKRQVAPEG